MTDDPAGGERQGARGPRWTDGSRLFRAVGVSFDGRKLILAAAGVALLSLGWWGLDSLQGGAAGARPGPLPRLVSEPIDRGPWVDVLATAAGAVADPVVTPAAPFARLLDPTTEWPKFLRVLAMAVAAVAVWGLFGGAIARIALVDLAGGERPGIASALRFAARRLGALVGAPLSPLIGLGFFGALCGLVGLLYRLPGAIGPTIAGLLGFLPLLAGLVMALIVVGLAAGWPLMVQTVAAEGEDAFDALSRSYSYVYQRPWRYAGYVAAAWAIGVVGFLFVRVFAGLVVQMALWGLGVGAPGDRALRFFHPGAEAGVAASAHSFWLTAVDLLAFGWVYAYFWSATAVIYLLLRAEVDGAAMEDLYDPSHDRDEFVPGPGSGDVGPEEPAPTGGADPA